MSLTAMFLSPLLLPFHYLKKAMENHSLARSNSNRKDNTLYTQWLSFGLNRQTPCQGCSARNLENRALTS